MLRVCATGALRIHYAYRVYYYTKINPSPTYDISWESLGAWVATAVETNVSFICASAPALNAYSRRWFGVTGHHERSFGWYNRTERSWSPTPQIKGCSAPAPTTTQLSAGRDKEEMEIVDSIILPGRAYQQDAARVEQQKKSLHEYSRSLGSAGTLCRQDSIAPILKPV
jgi:hypothetical protein